MGAGNPELMINVAFLHVGLDDILPRIMTRSIRRAMPHAHIVHLTDEHTERIAESDEVVRLPYDGVHLMTYRLAHLAHFPPHDVVFLDTDCVVQHDLAPLFDATFDIGLTRREHAIVDPAGRDAASAMPYNTGVMLGKASGRDFWLNARNYCEGLSEGERRWWGDQLAVKAVAAVAPLRILELPCERYNYSPAREDEDVTEKYVVHYKGARKPWMVRRGQREFNLAA